MEGRKICFNHWLMSGFKTKMEWTIYLKIKQTSSVPQQFEVKSQSKRNAAYENKSRGCYKVIDQPADVCRWSLITEGVLD